MKKNEKHVTEQIRQPEEKKKGKKGGAAKWVALGIVLLILVATAASAFPTKTKPGCFRRNWKPRFSICIRPKCRQARPFGWSRSPTCISQG